MEKGKGKGKEKGKSKTGKPWIESGKDGGKTGGKEKAKGKGKSKTKKGGAQAYAGNAAEHYVGEEAAANVEQQAEIWDNLDQQRVDAWYAEQAILEQQQQQQQQQTLYVDPGWYDDNNAWHPGVKPQQAFLHYQPPPPTASLGAPGGVLPSLQYNVAQSTVLYHLANAIRGSFRGSRSKAA